MTDPHEAGARPSADYETLRAMYAWPTPFEPPARIRLWLPLRPGGPARVALAAAIIAVYGGLAFAAALFSGWPALACALGVLAMGTYGVGKVAAYVAVGAAIDRSTLDGWKLSRTRFGIDRAARAWRAIVTRAKNRHS